MERTLRQYVTRDARLIGLIRFFSDDSGQDLIEYALLCAFIGFAGMLAWLNIRSGIGSAYSNWGTGVQNLSACTPDPGGGGCP